MNLYDITPEALSNLVAQLQSNPDYRVLTRLQLRDHFAEKTSASVVQTGLILDTETTGMEPTDKIIELGMISFEFDAVTGQVYQVLERFNELEDPAMPIPATATKVNGITDDMVKGRRINDDEVNRIVAKVDLVIAHNSGFDRPYVEARWPIFAQKAWACSLKQIDWAGENMGSSKLDYIASLMGFFYDAHRAINDCEALLRVLSEPLPVTGKTGLQWLIAAAPQIDVNLAAIGSPFSTKDALANRRVELPDGSKRRYLWDGREGAKYWHIDLPEERVPAEVEWLKANIYSGKSFTTSVATVDALTRFSKRTVERERHNH